MSNVLLITLGQSPMIIPQAFFAYPEVFDQVHVFTTDNPLLTESVSTLKSIFANEVRQNSFSITAVKGLQLPNDTVSQKQFQEALFQWYIVKSGTQNPFVSISGGIKTIPSTMQQAARYFGAEDVFHVLSDTTREDNPKNLGEVKTAIKKGKIKIIRLGGEPGWFQFRKLLAKNQFLRVIEDITDKQLFWIDKPMTFPLTDSIKHIISNLQRIDDYDTLPFGILRFSSPEVLDWLNKPLNQHTDGEWVHLLPKIELHCHLGGFATQSPLLDIVVESAESAACLNRQAMPTPPKGWPLPDSRISLEAYMHLGDANGSALLKDRGCLAKQLELIYKHLQEQNIRYCEIRCSPDNYTSENRSAWEVLQDIRNGFQKHMDGAYNEDTSKACHVNLLIIATRKSEVT